MHANRARSTGGEIEGQLVEMHRTADGLLLGTQKPLVLCDTSYNSMNLSQDCDTGTLRGWGLLGCSGGTLFGWHHQMRDKGQYLCTDPHTPPPGESSGCTSAK